MVILRRDMSATCLARDLETGGPCIEDGILKAWMIQRLEPVSNVICSYYARFDISMFRI